MLRRPLRSSRCFNHAGVTALILIPRIIRLIKRPQSSGASMVTGWLASSVDGLVTISIGFCGFWVKAPTSRAMPFILRQSALLGVIFKVCRASSRLR